MGTLYRPALQGRGEVTCWGLVALVYARELGIDLPLYGEISTNDLLRIAKAMKAGAAEDGGRVVGVPQAFDVVLMRGPTGGSAVVHVGVMIDATGCCMSRRRATS